MEKNRPEPSSNRAWLFALGHFINDLYPAFLPPLLPLLVEKFQLTFTRASVLATVLSFSSSMTQPLFGYLADKLGGRTLLILGPLVGGVSLSWIGAGDPPNLFGIHSPIGPGVLFPPGDDKSAERSQRPQKKGAEHDPPLPGIFLSAKTIQTEGRTRTFTYFSGSRSRCSMPSWKRARGMISLTRGFTLIFLFCRSLMARGKSFMK
jgi:hypothetical protein